MRESIGRVGRGGFRKRLYGWLAGTFIPLETKDSVLLKDLYRVCWVDDRIFVFDRSDEINALFVFSDQGNFITRVGLRGQGPEEYLYLTHFFVDEKERILTLVDFGGTALLRYDLDTYQYISTQDVADYFVDCAPLDKENWIWYYPLGFATPQRENFYLKATDRKGEQDVACLCWGLVCAFPLYPRSVESEGRDVGACL